MQYINNRHIQLLWASLRNDTTECHRQEKHQILANLDSYFV